MGPQDSLRLLCTSAAALIATWILKTVIVTSFAIVVTAFGLSWIINHAQL